MPDSSSRKPSLVDLAEKVAEWFPELGGRSLAVSEVDPIRNDNDKPQLPVAVCALISEQNAGAGRGGATQINVDDRVLLQFAFEPEKYTREDGADSPFYAFYDYEGLRDRLLENLRGYRTPRNHSVTFVSLDVQSDPYAVYIAFTLALSGQLCLGDTTSFPFAIKTGIIPAAGLCNDLETVQEDEDPCPQ